jgi:hypothetical protein
MSDFDPDTFDPEAFMQETVEAEGSTKVEQLPPGEYTAIVSKVDTPKSFPRKDGSGFVIILNVHFSVADQPVNEQLGRNPVTIRQGYILDMKGNSLDFGKGKNIQLNRLRAALGQNTPQPWNPSRMEGQGPVLIKVAAGREYQGELQSEVKSVGTVN